MDRTDGVYSKTLMSPKKKNLRCEQCIKCFLAKKRARRYITGAAGIVDVNNLQIPQGPKHLDVTLGEGVS